jgi:hypothetical protein
MGFYIQGAPSEQGPLKGHIEILISAVDLFHPDAVGSRPWTMAVVESERLIKILPQTRRENNKPIDGMLEGHYQQRSRLVIGQRK